MKRIVGHFLGGLGAMIGLTFTVGLKDDAFRATGPWYKDIVDSFEYYFFWVLPYWWMIILLGGIIVGLISYGVMATIETISKRRIG